MGLTVVEVVVFEATVCFLLVSYSFLNNLFGTNALFLLKNTFNRLKTSRNLLEMIIGELKYGAEFVLVEAGLQAVGGLSIAFYVYIGFLVLKSQLRYLYLP